MKWPFTVLLVLLSSASAAETRTLWNILRGEMIERVVVITPGSLSLDVAAAMSQSFFKEHRTERFAHYLIVTDAEDAFANLRGPGVTDMSPADWRFRYSGYPLPVPVTAEALRIGINAGVRIRLKDGRIVARVLRGSSPFRLRYQDRTVEVLNVGLARSICPDQGGATAHFFIRTGSPLTNAVAQPYVRLVTAALRSKCVSFHFEDQGWFAGEVGYPIYNRFVPYQSPPSLGEMKRVKRIHCSEERELRCEE